MRVSDLHIVCPTGKHNWARQHAWLLVRFFPFPVGQTIYAHCTQNKSPTLTVRFQSLAILLLRSIIPLLSGVFGQMVARLSVFRSVGPLVAVVTLQQPRVFP